MITSQSKEFCLIYLSLINGVGNSKASGSPFLPFISIAWPPKNKFPCNSQIFVKLMISLRQFEGGFLGTIVQCYLEQCENYGNLLLHLFDKFS